MMTKHVRYLFLPVLLVIVNLSGCGNTYHIYWGDVHGHTTFSDGSTPIDSFLTFARDSSRLDFVIVTDHDFGHAAPWRLSHSDWKTIQSKVDSYSVAGKFIAIAGYEWTSQLKYWKEWKHDSIGAGIYEGPVKGYNHKNVYFPAKVDSIFRANDPLYRNPNLLARAVKQVGGLIHNNHLSEGEDGKDQWEYDPGYYSVIVNTEISADELKYQGHTYHVNSEKQIQEFLNRGGKTGFVAGTDTHSGKPRARTAVLARRLTRRAIFEALRHRRNYAVSHAKIRLHLKINDHDMGEEIMIHGKPEVKAVIQGTTRIEDVALIRDGKVILLFHPGKREFSFRYKDDGFKKQGYYYLRVKQVDRDKEGNPSYAWSSPIWVKEKE